MIRIFTLFLLSFTLLAPPAESVAADSKELRKQRQMVQKERQRQKSDRNRKISDDTRAFRDYSRDLNKDYREQLRSLDTEFELRRVELEADHSVRVASAEAEYQKKLMDMFMKPGASFTEEGIQQMQAESKVHADALFALKKKSADELQAARMANEKKKHKLLAERDQKILDEAKSLGLTDKVSPILAKPIGEGLTRQEERWNEREKKDVVRIMERNSKSLSQYRNGEALRDWELKNKQADFKLNWEKKAKHHALDSEQVFFNTLIMQAAQGKEFDQQKFINQVTELNEKKKLIDIEYRKIHDKNRILRQEARKGILAK